jgi:hypothetical protein
MQAKFKSTLTSPFLLLILYAMFNSVQGQSVDLFKADTLFPVRIETLEIYKADQQENFHLSKHPQLVEYRVDSTRNWSYGECFIDMQVKSNKRLKRVLDTIDRSKNYYVNRCLLESVSSKNKTVQLVDTRKTAYGLLIDSSKTTLTILSLFTVQENQSPNGHVTKRLDYSSIQILSDGKDSLLLFDATRSSGYSDELRSTSSSQKSKYCYDLKRKLVFSIPYSNISSFRSYCRPEDGSDSFNQGEIQMDDSLLRIALKDQNKGEVRFDYQEGVWVKVNP